MVETRKKNKFGQEEMVGFALILILVAVILLVFLGFSLRSPPKESVESYEVESFLQSMLQYTTECEDNIERLSVQDLIFSCNENEKCADGKNSCEVLKTEVESILKESWKIGDEWPVKGYELIINTDTQSILEIKEGETTGNSKGAPQYLPKETDVFFKAYY
ncbi:hypothetical protein HYT25_03535 [Candidatus Pacearchaeota archaeon]|nr:hypothetical protein [Candidatus Pacearchaeota archaeon]